MLFFRTPVWHHGNCESWEWLLRTFYVLAHTFAVASIYRPRSVRLAMHSDLAVKLFHTQTRAIDQIMEMFKYTYCIFCLSNGLKKFAEHLAFMNIKNAAAFDFLYK